MTKGNGRRARWPTLRGSRTRQREVDEEMQTHFALRAEYLRENGLSDEDALAEAYRRFGSIEDGRARLVGAATERDDYLRRREYMDTIRQDLTYALRQLRRSPGFAFATILTLALGIGANATMFGLIDQLLLRAPSHITAPDRLALASIVTRSNDGQRTQQILSYPIYVDLAATPNTFQDVAVYSRTSLSLGTGAQATLLRGVLVSDSYFRTLGVQSFAGRFFLPEEAKNAPGANVAVLGYGAWQRQFAGDRAIIGRMIDLGGQQFTVVGIAPEGFTGVDPSEVDIWVPITAGISPQSFENWKQQRQSYRMYVVGRLRPGVTMERAAAAATTTVRTSEMAAGASEESLRRRAPQIALVSALPRDAHRNDASAQVALLLGGVSLLVLAIACANVMNLQLARAIRRRREIVIRLALGVSRRRLFAQLTVDALILALLGGAAALLIVAWGGAATRRLLTAGVRWVEPPVDGRVLLYTAAIALVAGIVTGLAPAMHAMRADLAHSLRTGGRDGGAGGGRARFVLLAIQTSLTVILLVGTGLFVSSLRKINALPIGMDPERVIVATINFGSRQPSDEERTRLYASMQDVARGVPGIERTAVGMSTPFENSSALYVGVPGRENAPVTPTGGPYFNAVGPGYFSTTGTRVIAGREFTDADRHDTAPVAIVNRTTASLWWPGENAVGKCVHIDADTMPCSQIVGVVENARRQKVLEDETVQLYSPMGQGPSWAAPRALFARVGGDATRAATALQRQLQLALPSLPYIEVRTLSDIVSPQTRSWRLGSAMFGAFGLLAVVLAMVGLYGMLSYDVAQRGPELGVRMALGATDGRIMRLIVSRGFKVALIGGIAGTLAALSAGSIVSPLLFQTSAREPAVYVAVLTILGAIVLIATALPAIRATRVQPSSALRTD